MRIIDVHTGEDVKIGGVYDGYRILKIEDNFFSARALLERADGGPCADHQGRPVPCPIWQALPVRFMHPSFLFQRVIFLPT